MAARTYGLLNNGSCTPFGDVEAESAFALLPVVVLREAALVRDVVRRTITSARAAASMRIK
jgi:hypothetical protein